ncbi:MAG: chemotaxis protein CheW [Trueperaceae bacterium]
MTTPSTPLRPETRSNRAAFFKLAGRVLALDGSILSQVVTVPSITSVPRGSDNLLGLFSTGGAILPLLDLHPMLGLSPLSKRPANLAVVLESEGETFAVSIDEILGFFPYERVNDQFITDDLQGFADMEIKSDNAQGVLLDALKLTKTFTANLAVL